MTRYSEWCEEEEKKVNGHNLTLLTADDKGVSEGVEVLRDALPEHYAAMPRLSRMFARLGKTKTAAYVEDKLPTKQKGRSGDLCEVLAVAFIEEETIFSETLRKLRWSDHREQAMRGDDMIAVTADPDNPDRLLFLKGEAKSRANLTKTPVQDARKALKATNGRPSPHALAFFADRLAEEGRIEISDRIDDAQRETGIAVDQLTHMIFAFSGNDSAKHLENDLNAYKGKIEQWSVGLRVASHQDFIRAVYQEVSLNGVG